MGTTYEDWYHRLTPEQQRAEDRLLDISIWKDANPDAGEPDDDDLDELHQDGTIITSAGEFP